MINKSHLTAISRKTLPAPTWELLNYGYIQEHILDYGCGKCHELNRKHLLPDDYDYDVDGYDPYYRPNGIVRSQYDTILCIYVLNVIDNADERLKVVRHIDSLLSQDGHAYFTVRKNVGNPHYTFRKTYQAEVRLHLQELFETYNYLTYKYSRGQVIQNPDLIEILELPEH